MLSSESEAELETTAEEVEEYYSYSYEYLYNQSSIYYEYYSGTTQPFDLKDTTEKSAAELAVIARASKVKADARKNRARLKGKGFEFNSEVGFTFPGLDPELLES